jgi:hypothetical protein
MTTATKVKAAKAAKKAAETPPEQPLKLLPAGTLRTHILAVKPANMSVEEYLRHSGYAA